jgi:BNR repeat-like domain
MLSLMLATLNLSAASAPSMIEPPDTRTPYKQPQVAISGDQAAITWGMGNAVLFAKSTDGGRTFGAPVTVSEAGVISLGMHRGPRIAMTPSSIVITSIYGDKGKGADGDLLAFRSSDGGRTWSKGVRVNDQPAAAREGLHAMAVDGNFLYAVWLDDRNGGKSLYGAASTDGGATWSANREIYRSPEGHICECCHPSVVVGGGGKQIYAMFRNWLGGSRDFYLAESKDGGRGFTTRKLGEGTWPLNACPMDGGGLILDDHGPLSVWRRESTVFLDRPGSKEIEIGPGKNAAIAGHIVVWSAPDGLRLKRGTAESTVLDPSGAYPAAASDGHNSVVVWEANGRIAVRALEN